MQPGDLLENLREHGVGPCARHGDGLFWLCGVPVDWPFGISSSLHQLYHFSLSEIVSVMKHKKDKHKKRNKG